MKDVRVRVIAEGTKKASSDIKKVTNSTKDLDKQAAKTSKSTKGMASGLTKGFGALRTAILNAVPALNAFKVALISTGVGAIVVAMGSLIGLFIKATNIGNKFAKEISTLGAITSKTNEELKGLSNQAKELGASTQFTAIEVVRLQTELAKLGFTILDIKNATPAILDLAASLEIDLASAAELAGSVVRSFGLTTEDTKKVVDTLAKSTSISGLNFEALKESLKVVAPTARATGVSLEKTTSLLAVLADNGLKGSMAGTGLAKTFIELSKKGISLEEAIGMVNGSSNGLNTSLELVGINGSKALNTLAASADKLDPLLKQLTDVDDAAKELAERRLDNAAGDVTKLGSAWDGFMLSLEDGSGVFSNMYRGIIQGTTAFISGLQYSFEYGGAFIKNFFKFISEGFEASKKVVSSGFGSMASNVEIFALKAMLAMSDVPILGKALNKESIKANLKEAEDELSASQGRMLEGMTEFSNAANLLSGAGVLKTMVKLKSDQEETTALRTGGGTDDTVVTTDPEEVDEDGVPIAVKEKEKATAGFFSMMQLDKIKSLQDANDKIKKIEDKKLSDDEKRRAKDLANFKATENAKNAVRNAALDAVSQGFSIMAGLAEENKGLQAASIIAENATGIAKNIINTNAANARLTLEGGVVGAPSLITANNIRMGIGIASSVAAAAKGLSELGKGGAPSRGDSSEASQAPAFNLVEGTESNSIQSSIENQGSQPIKAYVVSGEVQSQASLDRQIQDSASI